MVNLVKSELTRYARQISLTEIGVQGQNLIKQSRVLVIGAGGLGCPVLLYLVAAGVGTIGIVEHDVVDESNLQRQVLYTVSDIGKPKALAAKLHLQSLNPHVNIVTYTSQLNADNALELLCQYDIIVDATDNFTAKYLINDACFITKKPFIYASISQFEGQISVFNYHDPATDTHGPNYRDLYPEPPPPHLVQNCTEAGVLGVLPGLLGCLQANEVLKIIVRMGIPLSGQLLFLDALTLKSHIVSISKRQENPLNDSSFFENGLHEVIPPSDDKNPTNLSTTELKNWLTNQKPLQLVDVREAFEREVISLGGLSIPLRSLTERMHA